MGKEKQLVHYSHSCDLKPGPRDPGGPFREREMQISCDGTADRWGGFGHITFFNATTQQNATIEDLKNKVNAASANEPLWIIEAGEPDIIWEAVNKARSDRRKFLYIITHHPHNDRGDYHDLSDIIKLGVPSANVHRIPNQNTLLKKPLRLWHWARDHKDPRIKWLWDRGYLAQTRAMKYPGIVGDMDPSDAGMVYYWGTLDRGGDRNCDVPKLKRLFLDYVNQGGGGNQAPTLSFSAPKGDITVSTGYRLQVVVAASDSDGQIDNVKLYVNDKLVRQENRAPYEWGHAKSPNPEEVNGFGPGTYTFKAVAMDNQGGTATKSITLTVKGNGNPGKFDFHPTQDSFLSGGKRENSEELRVEQGNRVSYLLFDLSALSGTVAKAELKLTVGTDDGQGTVNIYRGTNTDWTENNLSAGNKPAMGSLMGSINTVFAEGKTYTWLLNGVNTGGKLCLVLAHNGANDVSFWAKEGDVRPLLAIETASSNRMATSDGKALAQAVPGLGLSVYPNPSKNHIMVKGVHGQTRQIQCYNAQGQVVHAQAGCLGDGPCQIDVSGFEAGLYWISVVGEHGVSSARFVKAK